MGEGNVGEWGFSHEPQVDDDGREILHSSEADRYALKTEFLTQFAYMESNKNITLTDAEKASLEKWNLKLKESKLDPETMDAFESFLQSTFSRQIKEDFGEETFDNLSFTYGGFQRIYRVQDGELIGVNPGYTVECQNKLTQEHRGYRFFPNDEGPAKWLEAANSPVPISTIKK